MSRAGYGSMLFADNQALQSFGLLAMVGEIACVFAALFSCRRCPNSRYDARRALMRLLSPGRGR